MNRIIIAGGRTFSNYEILFNHVMSYLISNNISLDDIEIVSGCCEGVDKLGEKFAEENHIPVKRFPAEWTKYGKFAGLKRNQQMIDYANSDNNIGHLIAFWDGNSRGTKYTIEHSKLANMSVEVINYEKSNFNCELYEGVIRDGEEDFKFDFTGDSDGDIISFSRNKIHSTKHKGNILYYGYRFNSDAEKSDINSFLSYIKDNADHSVVREFINICIDNFYSDCETKSFDYIIQTPSSSNLVSNICDEIVENFDNVPILKMHKKPAAKLEIDYEKLNNRLKNQSKEVKAKIIANLEQMAKRIKKKEYFSLSKQVWNRYRDYIKSMVEFDNVTVDLTEAKNVLVVDDNFVTGTTFNWVVETMLNLGYSGNIYLFSIMNSKTKEKSKK